LDAAPAKITTQAETEEAGDQDEVLEIREDSDFRRYPADHQHFHEQAQEADQRELAVAETAQILDRNFQPAQRRGRALQAIEHGVYDEYGDCGD
jgi:hypothetical protein